MLKPKVLSRRKSGGTTTVNPFLKDIVRSFRTTIAAVFVFSFFLNLLMLTVPLYLVQIYDKVLPNQNYDTLMFLTAIALVAVLALGLLESVRRTVLSKLGVRFDNDVSEHLLSSAINRSIRKSYASVNIMRDLATLRRFLSGSSMFPMLDVPWTPMFILILYFLHPVLGIFGLVGALLLFGLAVLNEYATRNGVRSTSVESRQMIDTARSYLRNSDVVQAMGMHSTILADWKDRNAEVLTSTYKTGRINTRLLLASKMLRLFLQVGIIGTAAWLILRQELTPGGTMASVLILRRAISPLEQSINSWKSVIRARAAFQNISEYLNNSTSLVAEREMPVPQGRLLALKASFRRTGEDRSVFSRISIAIDPGKITAIVGPTAEGKSTLIRVLAGIVPPTSGKITLGGYELSQWTPDQLGPSMGYLPQDVGLFPGTVRDNISRMTEQPIEDVIAAAKLANAHELIQGLPAGYNTEISEDGQNLSGGQQQKIGLARAVFGNPRVVLLDEPDANLDSNGRSLLRKSLRQLRRNGVAVLVITHQDSLERISDVVYRLEAGKLTLIRAKSEAHKDNSMIVVSDAPAAAKQTAISGPAADPLLSSSASRIRSRSIRTRPVKKKSAPVNDSQIASNVASASSFRDHSLADVEGGVRKNHK